VQGADALVEALRLDQAGGDRVLADALDHRRERPAREAVDEIGPARVDVDHPRRHADVGEPGLDQERVDAAADERVAAGPPLKLDLAVDRLARRGAVGVKQRRPVVALDDGDRAAGPDHLPQDGQRLDGPGQVLEDEADEDMVERPLGERQRVQVGLPELDARHAGALRVPPRLVEGSGRHVDRHDARARAAPGQRDGLRAHATPGLEHGAARRIGRLRVQQLDERARLVAQAVVGAGVVAVDVAVAHGGPGYSIPSRSSSASSARQWRRTRTDRSRCTRVPSSRSSSPRAAVPTA
jgi:hypothetical protein